jgi:3-methyladenine DNA glycosylase AlkD
MPVKKPAAPVKAQKSKPGAILTAKEFVARLLKHQSDVELEKIQRYFKSDDGQYSAGDKFIGVRMGQVFALAKEFMNMELDEVEKLLENPIHEVRAGAVSIMDFQARNKKTSEARRKELFDLYINRHDCINNWDLVDRSAPHVVGGYLFEKPRAILYQLAKSKNMWARRTAITSTFFFIRQGDVDDTFKIAELLLKDKQDLIHKAAGGWIREAGKKAPKKLIDFLDRYAATMPRTMLRYALEHLNQKQREHYLSLGKFPGHG